MSGTVGLKLFPKGRKGNALHLLLLMEKMLVTFTWKDLTVYLSPQTYTWNLPLKASRLKDGNKLTVGIFISIYTMGYLETS